MRIKTKADRRERIKLRQRKRIMGTKDRPRLSVFRSESHIYAQVIDDLSGQTLVSASSVEPKLKSSLAKDVRGGNLKGAEAIGKTIAERSIEKGIKQVVFDRGGFLYHGRIRQVADAARKAGLEF
jgi:large subunit ribosomal protein L18